MDLNKVVADAGSCVRFPQGEHAHRSLVTRKGVNEDDIVTSQIDTLEFPFAGAFTGKPADGLTETVLAQTSTNAELVESMTAGMSGQQILKDFKATGIHYALAVRLVGKFKTAFPEGKPAETPPGPNEPKPAMTNTNQIKESAQQRRHARGRYRLVGRQCGLQRREFRRLCASPSPSTATSTFCSTPWSNCPATAI